MREEWREEEDGWSFTLAMRSFPRVTSGDVDRFVTAPVPNMCNPPQEPCSASAAPPSISSVASPNKASTKAKAHRRRRATLNIETTPTHHLRIRASAVTRATSTGAPHPQRAAHLCSALSLLDKVSGCYVLWGSWGHRLQYGAAQPRATSSPPSPSSSTSASKSSSVTLTP